MTGPTPGRLGFQALPDGPPHLVAAVAGADLLAADYVESEWAVSGVAEGYAALDAPADGHWKVETAGTAPFTTRLVLRRPRDPQRFSGVAVVEWLNVSSGADAAPDYRYLAEEIVRRGHLWIGLSAQRVGVEGGISAVSVPGDAAASSPGLKGTDPDRYGELEHPGDRYCYGIFSEVLRALRADDPSAPWADLDVRVVLAVGESQSAYALTTYYDAVHPRVGLADGFLVHSRGAAALSLGEPGAGIDLNVDRKGVPTRFRTDLDAPVIVVQTETDVLSPRFRYRLARQPDTDRLRVWEVAGTAHADLWQIGEFEEFLGAPDPVNRGQQGYVVRSALRWLERWVREGAAPPRAPVLAVLEDGTAFAVDELGNVRGGVRTPTVDAAVEVHSGFSSPEAPVIAQLFGRTLPADPALLVARYPDAAAYLAAYEDAVDAAIAAGFVLPEDRAAILAESRPDLLPG